MAGPTLKDRRRAFRRGHLSEYRAALAVLFKGYRIVAIRYRTKSGEIDLIARKGRLVAFIEVKARRALDEAVFAVTPSAQHRIRNASLAWLARQPDSAELALRYDIVAVLPWRWPMHLEDAF